MYADVILKPIKKTVKTVGELLEKVAPQIPNFVKGIKSGVRGVVVTAKEWVGRFFKSMAEKFSKEADNFVRYVDKIFGEAAEETIENGTTSGGKWIDDLAESGSKYDDMILNGFDDWRDAEKYLNETFGGSTQKTFNTSIGGRRVDNLTSSGIAQESKVGYNSLTDSVKTQALKDVELLNSVDEVKGVEWHFFKSGTTGKVGPSGPLKEYLEGLGIKVVIY